MPKSARTPERVSNREVKIYGKQHNFLESRALFRAFVGGIGSGKALSLDTRLPTLALSGWTTIGNIQRDQVVFDECGTPCRVVAIGEVQLDRRCLRVVFSDDTSIVADAEHEWVTHTFAYRKALARCKGGAVKLGPSLLTTQQIADTLFYDGRIANHSIPLAGPLDCSVISLPIEPYTMGAWLGDGTTTSATITSADHEVLDSIRADGYEVEKIGSQDRGAASFYSIFDRGHRRMRGLDGKYRSDSECLHVILRRLGLMNGKFIPPCYLRASIDQRRDLFRGLMDTDGCVDESGSCEFTTTKLQLAEGFLELCRSLRIKTTMVIGRATIDGEDYGPKYRFSFTPYWSVFTIQRKQVRQKKEGKQASRQLTRYIKEIIEVKSVPVRCIEVDSPSHQYLAGDGMIPTHNSFIGALDVLRRAKPGRLYLVTAPTYPMLSDATFRSVVGMATDLDLVSPSDIKSSPPPSIKLRNGAEVLFRSTDNYEMLRGPNLSGIWMDEASLSKQEAFDILIGRLREGGEMGWMSATFTPKGKAHWTYKTFASGQPDTELVTARSDENPFLPPTFVANVRRRYTADQSRQELGGDFLEGAGNHYYPSLWPRYKDVGDAYRIYGNASLDGVVAPRVHHIRKADCSRLLTLDWAMGKPKRDRKSGALLLNEKEGDHTAFVPGDLDPESGLIFLLDCFNERVDIAENAPRLAEMCRRWKPVSVCGDDDNLSETMLLECRRYRDIPTVRCLSIGGKNKLVRSQAAIVRAERGMLLLPERHAPWVDVLSDQLAAFTGVDGNPDDIADCVGILGRLADEFVPQDPGDEYESVLGAEGWSNQEVW